MRAVHVPVEDEIREERKRQYLKAWPIEAQLEALSEAAAGRPEKQERMMADFQAIRGSLPYLSKGE